MQRKTIAQEVINGRLTITEAARKLGVNRKAISRSIKRYKAFKDEGLVHKNRGKISNCARNAKEKQLTLKTYRDKYMEFGPVFAAEKLQEEDNITVHPETLRLWLLKAYGNVIAKDRLIEVAEREDKANRVLGDISILVLVGHYHFGMTRISSAWHLQSATCQAISESWLTPGIHRIVLSTQTIKWIDPYPGNPSFSRRLLRMN